ncbi:MAG: heme/copper-type cytochrome/quinol oxidase subunit 4 [Lentimonas sp.]|jgi:heme/copper-type cytochrome/quinol oxidase subunit 4
MSEHISLISESKQMATRRTTLYLNVAIILCLILFAEMVLVQMPGASNLVFGLLIGLLVIKFTGLLFWFMELHSEKRLLTWLFLLGLLVAVGTVTAMMAIMLLAPESSMPIFKPE